jgi:two-component system chemotaxis response regulator CheB
MGHFSRHVDDINYVYLYATRQMSVARTDFKADAAEDAMPASGAVAIIGSAGGIPALIDLLAMLPVYFPLPIIVAQHLSRDVPSILPKILARHTHLPVKWAEDDEHPRPGIVYVLPPGCQLHIQAGRFLISPLAPSPKSWLACPSILLKSLAQCYGEAAVGIVLSGVLPVGISGLRAIQAKGGVTIAQDEVSSSHFDMPRSAIDLGKVDIVLPPERIAEALAVLAAAATSVAKRSTIQATSHPEGEAAGIEFFITI